jgi:ankyrin repeat protein
MPTYKAECPQSTIQYVSVSINSYDAEEVLILSFDPKLAPTSMAMFENLLNRIQGFNFTNISSHILSTNRVDVAQNIFDYLIVKNLITNADISSIGSLMQLVNKHRAERNITRNGITLSQKEVLLSVSDTYVDDIIENTNNSDHTSTLLRAAFSSYFRQAKNDLVEYINSNLIDPTVIGSVEGLWKICSGNANLENTFSRLKAIIPSLTVQRDILLADCSKKLLIKYKETPVEDLFLLVAGLCLYRGPAQRLSPLSDVKMVLTKCLSNDDAPDIPVLFAEVDFLDVIRFAFIELGFYHDGVKSDEIKRIQQKFNSSIIAQYLVTLEEAVSKEQLDNKNLLYQALKENSLEKVQNCFEGKSAQEQPDINQYFHNSLTPIIMAIAFCSDPILEYLVAQNADVEKSTYSSGVDEDKYYYLTRNGTGLKPRTFGPVTPLMEVIRVGSLSKLLILLANSVNVLTTYHRVKPAPSHEQQRNACVELQPIIGLALEEIEAEQSSEKSNERKKLFAQLIRHGAGYAINFYQYPEIINNSFIIGGTYLGKEKITPITNASQFIAQADVQDYPHWQKIINNMITTHYDRSIGNEAIRTQLMAIKAHVDATLNNKQSPRIYVGSPHTAAGDAHLALIRRVEYNLNDHSRVVFSPFASAIASKEYAKALRCACTSPDAKAFELIKILLEYKIPLNIKINEQAGADKLTALHHCAKKHNHVVYDYLVSMGADDSLTDIHGKKASYYMNNNSHALQH